jgi:hypothetical protein
MEFDGKFNRFNVHPISRRFLTSFEMTLIHQCEAGGFRRRSRLNPPDMRQVSRHFERSEKPQNKFYRYQHQSK